jgi:transposase-like protein
MLNDMTPADDAGVRFTGRHFEVLLRAVKWYLRYVLSYKDLEKML